MKLLLVLFTLAFSTHSLGSESTSLGSGHADLKNLVINYEYEDFGGFHLRITDTHLTWQGFVGFFKDIVSTAPPQVSKVAEGIYFVSWPTRPNRGDNVVWNFNTMSVNAHLGGGDAFKLIHGVIHCWAKPECIEPSSDAMPPNVIQKMLAENVQALGMPSIQAAMAPTAATSPADLAGLDDLAGNSLIYTSQEGSMRLDFDGKEVKVSAGDYPVETHVNHATRIAKDVYFISWGGDFGGNHILVNTMTMKVFDHISGEGHRSEQIYDVACFGETTGC